MDLNIDHFDHGEDLFFKLKQPLQVRQEKKETHRLFSIDEPEFDTSTYFGRFR